jgi:hypothetical protein
MRPALEGLQLNLQCGLATSVASCCGSARVQGITEIKVMTDAALLREVLEDPLLSGYSVIIVDEIHERSTSSDLLLGLLRKVLPLTVSLKRARTHAHAHAQ